MTRSDGDRLLFSPLRLGPVTVPNRIVFAAHLTDYATDGLPTAQHVAYYGARAAGGAGLVVTEEQATHPGDRPYEKIIRGFDPAAVPGYNRITEAVHRHGSRVFAQLNHNGPQSSGMYTRRPVWGPSPVVDPAFREVPKAMEPHEIDEVVAGFATTARHCAEGGFDGVEIQASHSSVLRCFLSPVANQRTDAYGGTAPRRARLLLEVVAAVRAALGPGLAVGVRLCGDEMTDDGTTVDDALVVARLIEAQGRVDYLNTAVGVATASLHTIVPSMRVPSGYALPVAAALRRTVRLPVVGVGRFTDPGAAGDALAAGHCDLVGVVRGQVADPDFAAKARDGRAGEIRTCLGCNQECIGRTGRNRWLGCLENPRAGREATTTGVPVRAGRARRVVVVGAGPGGLQAAATAARRGHRVTVLERADHPGGAVPLAASAPGRAGFGALVANLVGEAGRHGVDLRLGTDATVDGIRSLRPDAVVVATGAEPDRPAWAPSDDRRVVDVTDVLAGRVAPAGAVVVVDGSGFHPATSVAELLAGRGATVTVATDGMVVGADLGLTLDLEHWLRIAADLGIRERTGLVPRTVTPAGLEVLHHPTGAVEVVRADWIVLAVPARPADRLYHALRQAGVPGLHRVGDCVAPRRAHAAVVEGDRIGRAL